MTFFTRPRTRYADRRVRVPGLRVPDHPTQRRAVSRACRSASLHLCCLKGRRWRKMIRAAFADHLAQFSAINGYVGFFQFDVRRNDFMDITRFVKPQTQAEQSRVAGPKIPGPNGPNLRRPWVTMSTRLSLGGCRPSHISNAALLCVHLAQQRIIPAGTTLYHADPSHF